MDTHLDLSLAASYTSHSQIARVVTEGWVAENMYCPRCGCSHLTHLTANRPVADLPVPTAVKYLNPRRSRDPLEEKLLMGPMIP